MIYVFGDNSNAVVSQYIGYTIYSYSFLTHALLENCSQSTFIGELAEIGPAL